MVKFNGEQFSTDPLNLTNMHNASSSGIANEQSIGLHGQKEKSKKGTRSTITLIQKHKSHNKISKKKNNSQSKLGSSFVVLRRGINRIGKVVKGLSNISDRTRRLAIKRLQRLHVANRPIVKRGAAKKTEEKK